MNFFSKKKSIDPKEKEIDKLSSLSKQIEKWYNTYKSKNSDNIEQEGIELFCKDIGIDPMNPLILVISFLLQSKEMGIFTRKEFIEGMEKLGCGNLENFKKELPKFQEFLNDPKKFKEIYIFTFHFAKEKSKKGISFSYAQFFWNIFFSQKYEIQSKWDEFLNQLTKKNDITEDQWRMYYEFLKSIKGDIKNYEDSDAWPIIIDEFISYCKKK